MPIDNQFWNCILITTLVGLFLRYDVVSKVGKKNISCVGLHPRQEENFMFIIYCHRHIQLDLHHTDTKRFNGVLILHASYNNCYSFLFAAFATFLHLLRWVENWVLTDSNNTVITLHYASLSPHCSHVRLIENCAHWRANRKLSSSLILTLVLFCLWLTLWLLCPWQVWDGILHFHPHLLSVTPYCSILRSARDE